MITIRRAKIEDAQGIHQAHMESIQKLCAKDYTPEQIEAWGNRPFNADMRIHCIENDFVWVAECDNNIEGFIHMTVMKKDDAVYVDLSGLYLTPKIKNQGIGRELLLLAEKQTKLLGIGCIQLRSTLTSEKFYAKMGYQRIGDIQSHPIRDVEIPYLLMEKYFSFF